MGILLHRFWLPHHDTAPREKKDVVALALTVIINKDILSL